MAIGAQLMSIEGYYSTWIGDIGVQSGLFRTIADATASGPGGQVRQLGVTTEWLAERSGLDPLYVKVWAEAAYALEWLEWDREYGYRLPSWVEKLFVDPQESKNLENFGKYFQFSLNLSEAFRNFGLYLRTGQVLNHDQSSPVIRQAFLDLFTQADFEKITTTIIPHVPGLLDKLKQPDAQILDIGTGIGRALVHYAKTFEKAKVVGIEVDINTFRLAERTVQGETIGQPTLANRIILRHQDAFNLSDSQQYDLVTLNITLHELGSRYTDVLVRIKNALKDEGIAIISELSAPAEVSTYRTDANYKLMASIRLARAMYGSTVFSNTEMQAAVEEVFGAAKVLEDTTDRYTLYVQKEPLR